GYLGAFCLANVNSVQEATTTHYTHTIRPRDPLLATGRQARLTTLYFEATGPDAGRRKAAYPDLTVLSFTLTVRPGEFIALAADFIGSGREDAAAAPTIPALASAFEIDSQQILIELGDQGGALTDISERLRELTITVNQVIDEAGRYRPTGGALANARFAARMPFLRRTASISIALGADRANTDIKDRVLNEQRSHIKITGDSGVLAGTGTVNHKFVFNVPDCRLREAPLEFDDSGAFYRVAIPETSMFPDSGIGNVPFELVVDNTQVSYFV
ncbi:MAG: phage tail tube protein, partial [Terriglobia bacterium]